MLDVGGATGTHARWLVADGHAVTLVDPVPAQVDVAARIPGVRALVGDARSLDHVGASADAVIMLGPLYHLQDRADRLRALTEALRVLRPGGVVFAGAISRLSALTKTVLTRGFCDLPTDEVRVLLENGTTAGSLEPAPGAFRVAIITRLWNCPTSCRRSASRTWRSWAWKVPAGWVSN